MTQALKIVLAQLSPRLRRMSDNVETMVKTMEERPEADLVLFPELFMSGYTTTGIEELAVDPEGPEVGRVARAAKDSSARRSASEAVTPTRPSTSTGTGPSRGSTGRSSCSGRSGKRTFRGTSC